MNLISENIGSKYYRLTVELKVHEDGVTKWKCTCDCGSIVYIQPGALASGNTRSCGCLRKENMAELGRSNATHGMTNSPEYETWRSIKKRCYNPKATGYDRYGGRGITMCGEWLNSFEAFYRDMGPRPSLEHSIERRENDKGYYKENCYWATILEQSQNKRSNVLIHHNGQKKILAQWCRELNLKYKTIHDRLQRGISFETAITY